MTGLDVAAGRLVFTASEPTRLSELYDGGPAAGGRPGRRGRRLTSAGDAFAAGRELVRPERFTAVSADGSEVDAWIMRPAGYEQGKKYPTLLNIHGGPYGQYGVGFFDEFQVYCGAGYAVRLQQPARLLRRHRGVGAGHPRPRRASAPAGAPSTTRTAWPSSTRRSAASTSSTRTASASSAAPTAAT